MRTSVRDDVPLPALPLTHIIENRDAAWCLHDPPKTPAVGSSKFGQSAGQATISQRTVLGIVVTIHPSGVVTNRQLGASRRRHRIVLAAAAGHRPGPAGFGCLQQREAKFLIGSGCL